MGMGMGMEVDATASQAPLEGGVYQARPNTAPTADYVRLLEETFGPGSVLRGEGEKPVALGSRRKGAKGRDGSVGTSVSAGTGRGWSVSGSEVDVDVGMEVDSGDAGDQSLLDGQAEHEAEHDGDARPSRVSVWMADLQVLVKGKRKMTRADMASLAQTMEDIKDVDAEEVSTDGPQLWRCLWEVSQLAVEDVPFGDEHGLRKMARRLLRHWPEEL
ncbi:hypothetical protein B0H16DRAFT_1499185 [Mycena metata]|uniref:Uncharacterized protein n=1 Tax=Mycena metata TaxID=1033252 RepID=A0AAD7KAM8_9AGAR|nr:hypothetical protein B0H16DRAFT_1499185 [Mycena metata]